MASSAESIDKGVKKMADYVKLYCKDALRGDVKFLNAVREYHSGLRAEAEKRSKLKSIEEKAKKAWKQRDYRAVIDILAPAEGKLGEFSNAVLAYSRKRLLHQNTKNLSIPFTDEELEE